MAPRLLKGTLVFVQGELSTREYDRAIRIPSGKKAIEHVIQQIAVELKADIIRILDRAINPSQGDAVEPAAEEEPPS
jgi:single-strand DNA-binding protein